MGDVLLLRALPTLDQLLLRLFS